jgi:acetyl esterase/lipase
MKQFFPILKFSIWIFLFFSLIGCTFQKISENKNIVYQKADEKSQTDNLQLNIFSPDDPHELKNVFVFLHGGGWSKGKKSIYSFLGKRMALKGVVAVIIDYPLSPKANYNDMAIASAKAIKWVKENISRYGGNPERIYISGHSAGGHLAALISVRDKYFANIDISDPIKGVILIDAAGLDMNKYLTDQETSGRKQHYLDAFTKDHAEWKEASPVYYVHKGVPPMLIFTGEKTYANIRTGNERFISELDKNNVPYTYKVLKGKHHIPMVFQLYNKRNTMYNEMVRFMKEQK